MRNNVATQWWPAMGYVVLTQQLPEEADASRRVLLQSLRDAWISFAPFIDDAVKAVLDIGRDKGPLVADG